MRPCDPDVPLLREIFRLIISKLNMKSFIYLAKKYHSIDADFNNLANKCIITRERQCIQCVSLSFLNTRMDLFKSERGTH